MIIFTMGYTHKSARDFFNLLMANKVDIIVDIRLNNTSQLAGFTKQKDLNYFAKVIGSIDYLHYPLFAPTKDLLARYQKKQISWKEYEKEFKEILLKRKCQEDFLKQIGKYSNLCLLCSEEKPEQCHRRLVAEYLKNNIPDSKVEHL
jgi:uncharacterized protein (DUF488 family)